MTKLRPSGVRPLANATQNFGYGTRIRIQDHQASSKGRFQTCRFSPATGLPYQTMHWALKTTIPDFLKRLMIWPESSKARRFSLIFLIGQGDQWDGSCQAPGPAQTNPVEASFTPSHRTCGSGLGYLDVQPGDFLPQMPLLYHRPSWKNVLVPKCVPVTGATTTLDEVPLSVERGR